MDIACRLRLSIFEEEPAFLDAQRDRLRKALLFNTRFGIGRRDGAWQGRDLRYHALLDDPRWEDKLSGRQVSVRKNLEKNINKRAAEGTGFPQEITIDPLEIKRQDGTLLAPILQQLDCTDGWLTIGYRLP